MGPYSDVECKLGTPEYADTTDQFSAEEHSGLNVLGSRRDWMANVLGQDVFGIKMDSYVSLVDGVSKPVVRLPCLPADVKADGLARFFGAASGAALRHAYTTFDTAASLSSDGSTSARVSVSNGSESARATVIAQTSVADVKPFDVPGPAGRLLVAMNDMVLSRTGVMQGSQIANGCCYESVFKPEFRQSALASLKRWPTLRSLLTVPAHWFATSDDLQRVGVSVRGGNLHFQIGWGDGVVTALDVVTVGLRARPGSTDGVQELLDLKVGGPSLPAVYDNGYEQASFAGQKHDMKAKAWIGDAMHMLDARAILLEHCAYADAVGLLGGYTSAVGQARFLQETSRRFLDVHVASDWFESNYSSIHAEYREWMRRDLRAKLAVADGVDRGHPLSPSTVSQSSREAGSVTSKLVTLADGASKAEVLAALASDNDRVGFFGFLEERCTVRDFQVLEQCAASVPVEPDGVDITLLCRPSKPGPLDTKIFAGLVRDWFSGSLPLPNAIDKLVYGRSVGNVKKKDAMRCLREAV